ncbi:hypothetical protein N9B68_01845 [bacterium]|nr:hypothetical protein [bacterium]
MAKLKCSSCGYQRNLDQRYAGKKVACPKCNFAQTVSSSTPELLEREYDISDVSPANPQTSNNEKAETVVEGEAIRVGEFMKNTDGLPDRKVAIFFDGEFQQHRTLNSIKKRLSKLPEDRLVSAPNLTHFLKTISIKDGWMKLEYSTLTYELMNKELQNLRISTGPPSMCQNFEIIDTIFAISADGSSRFLVGKDGNPYTAFKQIKFELLQRGYALGADAVINAQFEHRIAVSESAAGGIVAAGQVIGFFGYGTAVRFTI